MAKRFLAYIALLLLALMFYDILAAYSEHTFLTGVAAHYVQQGPEELGAPNLVTAVVVTYRGLDTLGEVTVLFISAAGVGVLLRRRTRRGSDLKREPKEPASELVETASQLFLPMIFLLGIYIFLNGHLTPGGGFQGGAVIASGAMLALLALPHKDLPHRVMHFLESLSGFTYVLIGVFGIVLAGGFLDNRLFGSDKLGEYGSLFSAGAIPMIYIMIGLKVGTELSAVLDKFKEG